MKKTAPKIFLSRLLLLLSYQPHRGLISTLCINSHNLEINQLVKTFSLIKVVTNDKSFYSVYDNVATSDCEGVGKQSIINNTITFPVNF